jgi:hypothetical protein
MQEKGSMMRNAGHVLLWVGVLGGAFVAVRDPAAVPWALYAAMGAVALVGVVLLRRTASASQGSDEQIDRRVDELRQTLAKADEVLEALRKHVGDGDEASFDVYAIHERLDEELAEPLAAFAEGREMMIPAFGMTTYSEVMTRFAAAERLVNRTWSASADGYIDEVRTCVGQASQLLHEARKTLEAAGERT